MRKLLLLFIMCLPFSLIWAQETIIRFKVETKDELSKITKLVSIDNYENGTVTAYANAEQMEQFKKLAYKYEVLPHPSVGKTITMATSTAEMANWDRYPTYEVYIEMMNQFETNYPDLCQVINIGTSVNERALLAVKISDNVTQHEAEPEFFYTSTMHGDETAGFVLLLRLADWLLANYETNEQAAYIVDNFELYINPNANPDGTYTTDNNSISGATRYNAEGKDLNRDFPYPISENAPYQIETQAMIDFAEERNFVVSANAHGGAEVFNYPWDCWNSSENPPADQNWWEHVGRAYVDTARLINPNYMTYPVSDGVTEGADWYYADGSRQDYMNWFQHCREVTLELSNTKLLSSDLLPSFWEYNHHSLLNYIKAAGYGFNGTVTNAEGEPLSAMIFINEHDEDNSWILTDPAHGDYYRPIAPGTYDVEYSSEGYISQTHSINIDSWESIIEKNVVLEVSTDIVMPVNKLQPTVNPNPAKDFFTITLSEPSALFSAKMYDITGRPVRENIMLNESVSVESLPAGYYIIIIQTDKQVFTEKVIVR